MKRNHEEREEKSFKVIISTQECKLDVKMDGNYINLSLWSATSGVNGEVYVCVFFWIKNVPGGVFGFKNKKCWILFEI